MDIRPSRHGGADTNERRADPGRFAAFGNRNFRRYFVGQTVSSIGSWSTSLAVTWLVLQLTDNSEQLGVAMALQFLPLLVLGAPAGVLADRFDNRRLLLATSALSGAIAFAFGIVAATDHATIGWVYTFTLAFGLVLAVERPTMQAFVYQLVGPELLPRAVAANGTINAASRLVGPALAGGIISAFGVHVNFIVDAASYVIVIVALAGLRTDDLVPRPLGGRTTRRLRDGLAYVRSHPDVAQPLIVMAVVGTIALNFPTTFPSMVRFGFGLGAGSVGLAMSLSAVGSVLGGLYIAGVEVRPRRTFAVVLSGFGAAVLVLAAAPTYGAFLALSIPLGFASACFQSLDTVVLQQATEPGMQGRVMALHQMAWYGSTPVGALLMGWVISATSPRLPFVLGGVAAVACTVYLLAARAEPPRSGDRSPEGAEAPPECCGTGHHG